MASIARTSGGRDEPDPRDLRLVGGNDLVVTLFRVIGPHERQALDGLRWEQLPRRDDWSVIMVKLLSYDDALDVVARSWKRRSLSIISIPVRRDFADSVQVHVPDRLVGRTEYWIDASRLHELNANIAGPITPVRAWPEL